MARIITADGAQTTDQHAIKERLARLGIALRLWDVPTHARARLLMDEGALGDAEKEELLGFVEHRFDELKRAKGYQTRDLIVIHERIPGLAEMLARFERIHYHTDDEVRYVLAGRGYFGFVDVGGEQFLLEVTPGDYINVPAYTEHWFTLRDAPRIKAVRYFIDTSGWIPVYTGTPLRFAAG